MAASPNWGSLPNIIIVDIFSYLSHEDRLKTSSVCKRWRSCLFHPSLWTRIKFQLGFLKRQKSRFLADRCGRFVKEAMVKMNSHSVTEVRESQKLLNILSLNKNLQVFSLLPSSCHIEWPDSHPYFVDRYLDTIKEIIDNSRKLRHFSLGCAEDLLEHSNHLLVLLGRKHLHSLNKLYLASVKEDSENYGIIQLETSLIRPFTSLTHLSIDHDYLTNQMLLCFADSHKAKLQKLIIHVHGIEASHERISNASWRLLSNHSPSLQVTLNLVHSFEGVEALLDILQPCMPLAHFRQFFCSHLNSAAINYMSMHYRDSLQSIYVLDGLADGFPVPYFSHLEEDPFVMLAWRCVKLQHFTLIGYEISDDDVIAIARLRGMNLKTYTVPHCCICTLEEDDDNVWVTHGCYSQDFSQKISENLSWKWHPLEDDELPQAVFDVEADAEKAYMSILLGDQDL